MNSARNKFGRSMMLLLSCLFFSSTFATAQTLTLGATPEVIEVFWQSSKTVSVPGFSNVIVLDEDICRVEATDGRLQVFGLVRGETVAVGILNGVRSSIILRVVERPIVLPPPSLSRESAEFMGQGVFTSNLQMTNSQAGSSFSLSHGASWGQRIGDMRLNIRTDVDEPFTTGTPNFNIRTASVQFAMPSATVTLLDFNANLGGAPTNGNIAHVTTSNYIQLRGADVVLKRGDNDFEFFGGTS